MRLSILIVAGVLEAQQPAAAVTPADVRAAIADERGAGCYPLKDYGCFTTPLSRVRLAAAAARKEYRPFTEADVAPELLEPYLEVVAFPQRAFVHGAGRRGRPIDVRAVVIMPTKSKDRGAAILPSSSAPLDTRFRNMLGATFDAAGMAARFPLSALDDGNEVRFVYDGLGCADWKNKLASECGVRFKVDGVR